MKFQILQAFLILQIVSSEIISTLLANQKKTHLQHANKLNDDSLFYRHVNTKSEFSNTMSRNYEINTLSSEKLNRSRKNRLSKNQYNSFESRRYTKSEWVPFAKRSLLSLHENKTESPVTEGTVLNIEKLEHDLKVSEQMFTSTTYPSTDESVKESIMKNNSNTHVSFLQGKDRIATESRHKHGITSLVPTKIYHFDSNLSEHLRYNVTNNYDGILFNNITRSEDSLNKTFQVHKSKSSSNDQSNINWLATIDVDTLLYIPTAYNTEAVVSHNNSIESKPFLNEMFYNLTENSNCTMYEFPELNIICFNIDLYSVGEHLPNYTVVLDISYCTQIKLLKPLFPHLKMLKNLTLSNNHHRYITKAFMGLENLEMLDLSNNDIIALSKAFEYVPKLKVLDLSNNLFRTLNPVSNAVSYLKSLEILLLNNNVYVRFIKKEHMHGLKNCNITVFSLFNTTLTHVEQGSFSFLYNLKTLELSVNYMNEQALANVTCDISENVEILYLGQLLHIYAFPYDALSCLSNTRVRKLYLRYNYFRRISLLPNLPSLQALYLENCSLSEIDIYAFDNITNIEYLDLSGNKFWSFPTVLSKVKSLKKLRMDDQNIGTHTQFSIKDFAFKHLTNLESFTLTRLKLIKLSRYSLFGLKKLRHLFLYLSGLEDIEDYAFETLESLQILDLRVNIIETLSNFTFYGLNKLEEIYLTGNWITFSPSVYPFQFSSSLSIILIQYNQVENIPEGMFSNLRNLRTLRMGRNKIIPWSKRIFPHNVSLNLLELSQNNIDYISETMLEEFHQVTTILDLSKNPFNCTKCGMKDFQNFCLSTNLSLNVQKADDNLYTCLNPDYLHSKDFFTADIPKDICPDIDSTIINMMVTLLLCFFILLIISVSSLCYIFRWYIRYWIFHLKTNVKKKSNIFLQKNFTYDAFITYSSCDTDWVVSHLIPALENEEPRYKLCVHQRDFQVGRQITENILDAIENSRSVILILTEGFVKSEWCMYELHLAQHKLFGDTRDALILIKLKDINKKLYTKNLSYIEKTRRCFMWNDSNIGQKLFWEQVRKELGQPETIQKNRRTISM